MIPLLIPVWLVGCAGAGATTDPTEIMLRVGCHQDQALYARAAFVYHQKLLVRLHRPNGKLTREERREYTVTPTSAGSSRKLTHFEGHYAHKGQLVAYDKPGYEYKGIDIDGAVVDGLAGGSDGDQQSRDGISKDLFPLTTVEQQGYTFHLDGSEDYRGKPAYRISFEPKKNSEDAASWKGSALIDATDYQPVWVATKLAFKIPVVVKVLLGTNVEGLGFSVSFQKFPGGVWFPVSYGGEFHVRAVFFYARNMSISLANDGFQRAVATSEFHVDPTAADARR